MKKVTISVLLVFAVFYLNGCATPVKHKTASERPEVTINNVSGDNVAAEITNEMINRGYNVTNANNRMLSFEKPVENILAAALLGSRYDSQPNARVIYNINEMGDKVRVVANLMIVTNPGSAFERITPINESADSIKFQELLNSIKNRLEHNE